MAENFLADALTGLLGGLSNQMVNTELQKRKTELDRETSRMQFMQQAAASGNWEAFLLFDDKDLKRFGITADKKQALDSMVGLQRQQRSRREKSEQQALELGEAKVTEAQRINRQGAQREQAFQGLPISKQEDVLFPELAKLQIEKNDLERRRQEFELRIKDMNQRTVILQDEAKSKSMEREERAGHMKELENLTKAKQAATDINNATKAKQAVLNRLPIEDKKTGKLAPIKSEAHAKSILAELNQRQATLNNAFKKYQELTGEDQSDNIGQYELVPEKSGGMPITGWGAGTAYTPVFKSEREVQAQGEKAPSTQQPTSEVGGIMDKHFQKYNVKPTAPQGTSQPQQQPSTTKSQQSEPIQTRQDSSAPTIPRAEREKRVRYANEFMRTYGRRQAYDEHLEFYIQVRMQGGSIAEAKQLVEERKARVAE